ncbi:MAG TPA: hypothetical protein PKD64_13570 [Pirellulaceae bacterium]|nr:hypothetical protein [Pirellulaceae bacterium]HMO93214.1 hypothetical protein [Pirellulaceae bacterium]HMP70045.1 hypothetical protein [Pirellulaceae bacterium]
MSFILSAILMLAGLVSLVCWILTIVTAFKHNETLLGILSICGIVGFIIGWIKHKEWNHKQVMLIWSVAFAATIIFQVILTVLQFGN